MTRRWMRRKNTAVVIYVFYDNRQLAQLKNGTLPAPKQVRIRAAAADVELVSYLTEPATKYNRHGGCPRALQSMCYLPKAAKGGKRFPIHPPSPKGESRLTIRHFC